MKTLVWHGCYDEGWKGIIPDAAFEHPAKFSKRLVERILEHMEERGWLEKGAVVADPFAGVRLGGVVCAYRGYHWVGVELEQRFIDLGAQVCDRHKGRWDSLGVPAPITIKGDSRNFDALLSNLGAVVTSPPYVSGGHHNDVFEAWNTNGRGQNGRGDLHGYGKEEGQIGQLKEGGVDSVITSPVYSGNDKSDYNKNRRRKKQDKCTFGGSETYGQSVGQIGTLKQGNIDAVVSSVPFQRAHGGERGIMVDGLRTKDGRIHKGFKERQFRDADRTEGNIEDATAGRVDAVVSSPPYGDEPGQIGKLKKQTYWEAMKEVYGATFRALKPGGVMAIVVKDFVKGGKRQRLCDDTLKLLKHLGFEPLERARAMLVREWVAPDLFDGERTERKTRKSFFRRHLESKLPRNDERRIDWEEVLFVQKPA